MNFSQVLSKDLFFFKKAFKSPSKYGGIEILEKKLATSQQRYQNRSLLKPKVYFDGSLPIHEKYLEIQTSIQKNQVIIVCGETGSGKTTQIPKICLHLGRGVAGMIAHTQPRRLAARSVASRIAEELNTKLGESVGYKVRFTDETKPSTYIKLMTDGVLLAETQKDKYLTRYDTIIIDEAHERSLNIDFLLGYLKQILPKRPDLKLIITSATIDAEKISKHFNDAPVIHVSGRMFPVEVIYRPLLSLEEDETDIYTAIADSVSELWDKQSGDILVFLPGEREIRELTEFLRKKDFGLCLILPLYSKLSNEDQQKIFHVQSGINRIILSTNVAETSLTVPGIRYVIDTGLARIKRYSPRAKVEQLNIEKISQASANQRMGRCGRIDSGICIRLYSEEDFNLRNTFSEPEIIRSNLSAVILRMAILNFGDILRFPFIDLPEHRLIKDGYQLLYELGAMDEKWTLLSLGYEIAQLPIDPRLARILLAAKQYHCVHEMLIIVSALSIQDPRERPFSVREEAQKAHEIFTDKQSDFLSYIYIWDFFEKLKKEKKSNRQLMKVCYQYFLSYIRLREWKDLYTQLKEIVVKDMGVHLSESRFIGFELENIKKNKPNSITYEQIHRSILTGLVSQVGMKSNEGNDYIGARGKHFYLLPISSLYKSKPKWIVNSELMETTKIFARNSAKIEPEWIEKEASHLIKSHYFQPAWSSDRGEVIAQEKITFYGLTVIQNRMVSYGTIDPIKAHEIFIRGALIESERELPFDFYKKNKKILREIEEIEHKSRKSIDYIDDEVLYHFYFKVIPEDIVDIRGFNDWMKDQYYEKNNRLTLNKEILLKQNIQLDTEKQFPEYLEINEGKFPLKYRFEPHHPMDGVTLLLPLTILNKINPSRLEWLVQGMIREKIQLLIKILPKNIRRECIPISDFITLFLESKPDIESSLIPQLAVAIGKKVGNIHFVSDDEVKKWSEAILPDHCYMNLQIVDNHNQILGVSRHLPSLQKQLGALATESFRENSSDFEVENLTTWSIGSIQREVQFAKGKQQLIGFLALYVDPINKTVTLKLFDTQDKAEREHRKGLIRLAQLYLKEQMKDLNKGGLVDFTQIVLLLKSIGDFDGLKNDILSAVCDRAFIADDDLPWDEQSFLELINRARTRLPIVREELNHYLLQTAKLYAHLKQLLVNHILSDIVEKQLNHLIYIGFISETPWKIWPRLLIYLKAIQLRLEKYNVNMTKDKLKEAEIQEIKEAVEQFIKKIKKEGKTVSNEINMFKWDIEELRVSLFAQELKTPYPVSSKRLWKKWEEISKNS